MKNNLHPIEKGKNWSFKRLDRFLVFCLLDRAMSYEKVCVAFNALDQVGFTERKIIKKTSLEEIVRVLKQAGFRFPNRTGGYIKLFGNNTINLSIATREEIVTQIPGMGMKLASMFLRNTRGEKVAVLDVHIKNYLKERNLLGKKYLESEKNFLELAKKMGIPAQDLDHAIWQKNRIGNRIKELKVKKK